ncbi:hypothetical protein BD410DRAFT_801199 [Rickenella mellea]|uniref:Uncharacterized protein n=1 Tax=Rickenella mellea TaxID=50990 RepID=A0A4Y7QDZ2_9AGAM|nr:hypothetical protein BD410DRAFT_801199 [Rickenella mellea]
MAPQLKVNATLGTSFVTIPGYTQFDPPITFGCPYSNTICGYCHMAIEQEQEQEEQEQDELIKINPEEDPEGYMQALETKYEKMGANLTAPDNCVITKFELQDEFLYGTYSYLPALTL